MEENKSNLGTILVTALVTAAVVGGGMYFWQNQNAKLGNPAPSQADSDVALFTDSKYKLRFTTKFECKDYYSVKAVENGTEALASYGVYIPGATGWPTDTLWYYFSLYSKERYSQFSPDEMPGIPEKKLELSTGEVLAYWSPQDGPSNPPSCAVEFEEYAVAN